MIYWIIFKKVLILGLDILLFLKINPKKNLQTVHKKLLPFPITSMKIEKNNKNNKNNKINK
jgi:hypothetical protein